MSETIREKIISAMTSRLTAIRTANGYRTDIGRSAHAGRDVFNEADLDVVALMPKSETYVLTGKTVRHMMQVGVVGIAAIADREAIDIHEQMLPDIIENITGNRWTVPFTSGGTYRPVVGHTITGATSGATGFVESVTVDSGSWAAGTATGEIKIRRKVGNFEAENVDIGANTNVFTTTGSLTFESAVDLATGGYGVDIHVLLGGTDSYSEGDEISVKCPVQFMVEYETEKGNPYRQITT